MKTLTFILVSGISISGFCQARVNTTSTTKIKPSASLVSTTSAKKTSAPAEKPAKSCSFKEYKMEKQQMQTRTYYKCPKCDYESNEKGKGVCPKDGSELKLVIVREG